MTGFREHVLERYFSYRRRYVEYVLTAAPHRAGLAVLSEIARLAFVTAGSALFALVGWALVGGAATRAGIPAVVLFAALAALPTAGALFALRGALIALADRRRVEERAGASAKAQRR